MIRSFVINKYLSKEFCKVIINTILIFCCLGFIMNLFEEINYFKDQIKFENVFFSHENFLLKKVCFEWGTQEYAFLS